MQPAGESFLNLINRSRRGKLKVYLGYGPGVGKTYQMLLEGHRLKSQGVDVVAGIVETHGRADTASLCLGLPEVPPRQIAYHGVTLREMDVEALLRRAPTVALIDELAHTNVPGSANTRRYQDALEVLQAGIHVVTTLNVQHLESLYDTVERLIGVKVKERIPDWVLGDADQIVNVDLAPEDLRRRLEEGRVYDGARAGAALDNFFRIANLEQLRELTLREVASIIERRSRRAGGEGSRVEAPDQIVVCLSSRSPDAPALLRYASRLAGRLNRTWYALYVQTSHEDPARLDAGTRERLTSTLALAHQLGAVVLTYKGEDVADTILRFAREYRVGHVVMGRPGELPRWQRLLGRRTAVERVIAGGDHMAVVVVDETGVHGRVEHAPSAVWAPAAGGQAIGSLAGGAGLGMAATGVASAGAAADRGTSSRGPGFGAQGDGASLAVAAHGGRPEAATLPRLSDLVAVGGVALFDQALDKSGLLRVLVGLAVDSGPADGPRLDADDIVRQLERREREASTFLSEGLALPHVRIPSLAAPRAVLGLLRQGLVAPDSGSLEQVFLFLCPDSRPEGCLNLLATAARMFRQPELRAELRRAATAPQAIAALRRWEDAQETRNE